MKQAIVQHEEAVELISLARLMSSLPYILDMIGNTDVLISDDRDLKKQVIKHHRGHRRAPSTEIDIHLQSNAFKCNVMSKD